MDTSQAVFCASVARRGTSRWFSVAPNEAAMLHLVKEVVRLRRMAFRIGAYIKEWAGPFAAIITIVAALIVGVSFYLRPEIESLKHDLKALSESVDKMRSGQSGEVQRLDHQMEALSKKIDDLLTQALQRAFPSTGKRASIENLEKGNAVLRLANAAGAHLEPSLIDQATQASLDLAKDNPHALEPASAFVGLALYQRSTQPEMITRIMAREWRKSSNDFPLPFRPDFTPEERAGLEALRANVVTYFSGKVPRGKQFLNVPIGSEEAHERLIPPTFWEYVREVGKDEANYPELSMDGFHFRNVVFERVTVRYEGGPLILENVAFVNCRFRIPIVDAGRTLTLRILKEGQVSFKG